MSESILQNMEEYQIIIQNDIIIYGRYLMNCAEQMKVRNRMKKERNF